MIWQLWVDRRIQLSEVQHLSIDDIDMATEVADAVDEARRRKSPRKHKLPPGYE